MSKTVELARHLETLHINNMYKSDFYWTWDKSDEEIDAVFTVADALRDLRERNKNTKIFNSGLGISIFRDNSTRTRFSFASACNLLGLEEQVLDERSPRSHTARPCARRRTWSRSWPTSSAFATICSSARATSIRRPSWTRSKRATATASSNSARRL